jgi:hypothetical protein
MLAVAFYVLIKSAFVGKKALKKFFSLPTRCIYSCMFRMTLTMNSMNYIGITTDTDSVLCEAETKFLSCCEISGF